jgi:hypothetical protein
MRLAKRWPPALHVLVTDVGDSAALVSEAGRAVSPRHPAALALAWEDMLGMSTAERAELGARARTRVAQIADLDTMAGRFADLWAGMASGSRSAG